MAPEKIKLHDHYKGDQWIGMSVGPILINGATPPANLASVKIQFKDEDDNLGQEFNTTGGAGIGDITIDDAVNWVITVPEQLLNLDAGAHVAGMKNSKVWYWDFETIDANGAPLTLYKGTIKVLEDITG